MILKRRKSPKISTIDKIFNLILPSIEKRIYKLRVKKELELVKLEALIYNGELVEEHDAESKAIITYLVWKDHIGFERKQQRIRVINDCYTFTLVKSKVELQKMYEEINKYFDNGENYARTINII